MSLGELLRLLVGGLPPTRCLFAAASLKRCLLRLRARLPAGSNDERAARSKPTGTARDAGDDVQQLGGSSFGTAAVAELASAESSPARSRASRPKSPDADPSFLA